jgi:hypothetical protein
MEVGATFGNRMLTHLYIIWVVGLYEIFKIIPKYMVFLTGILILGSFILFNAYYINFSTPESRKFLSAFKGPSPIQLLQATIEGYRKTESAGNPFSFWYRSIGSGQYPSLHFLIWHPESRHPFKLQKKRSIK